MMKNYLRILIAGLSLQCNALPALANFDITQGAGTHVFSFDSGTTPAGTSNCAVASTECTASVPINTAGSPLFITATPGIVAGPGVAGTPAGGVVSVQGVGSGTALPISAASLPLPTGAATSALQTTINTTLGSPFQAGGSIGNTSFAATQATASNLNATVVGTGTFAVQATLQASATTAIGKVDPNTAASWALGATAVAVPANAQYIGINTGGNLVGWTGAVTNGGTFAVQAAQSGTWNITNISGTVSLPTGAATSANQTNASAKTQIVDGSGNVIASTSNNLNVQCANCSGSGVSAADAASFTAGTSLMAPVGAQYTSGGATACVTGHECTLAMGADRTLFAQLPHAEVAIGGATAPANSVIGGMVYNSGGITPSSGQGLALQSDASGNLKVVGIGVAQGSTTTGQTGSLVMGAVTTSAPTYTTAQTSPVSLDTAGNIRVNCTTGCGGGSGGTADADAVSFVAGTTQFTPIGGQYTSGGATACVTAHGCWAAMTADRALFVNLADLAGTALGAPSNYGTSPGAVEVQGVNAFVTNTVATNVTQVAGATISATNPLFTNISVGSAAISATNGLYANVLQGNAVLSITNPVFDRVVAGATGGASTAGAIVPNNTTAVVVKSGAGTLYGLQLYGINAAPLYVKFYNATSATCGSGTPVKRVMIPANATAADGAGSNVSLGSVGVNFSAGITYCATTGIGDADTTAPTANNFLINVDYL